VISRREGRLIPELAFTLLARLPDGFAPPEHPWHRWDTPSLLLAIGAAGSPVHKRYPGERHYFAPQVERVLFPPASIAGEDVGRWVRQPVACSLELEREGAGTAILSIELLEVVRVALMPGVTFGIVHLSGANTDSLDRMLLAAELLATRYRSEPHAPSFTLIRGGARVPLSGNEPLWSLAAGLFGDAHPELMHRVHIVIAARLPDEVDEADEAVFRRALGRGHRMADAGEVLAEKPDRDAARTRPIGAATVTFFGRSISVTHREEPTPWLYNVRSYWSEAALFALIQQTYLEIYAEELGRLGGEPVAKQVDDLFVQWLAFRNVLWWQELSYTTDVPGRIVERVHYELNTRPLFLELERAFATYVEARRHRSEDAERAALRGLQVYGAGFAAVSAAAAVLQVAGEDYLAGGRLIVLLSLLVLGALAAIATRLLLARRDR
jgi:hypothetical protein